MPFRRGADVRPFLGTSQEPLRLLQSVTPLELAAAVPFVKITKVDFRTGRTATDVPPLTYDLIRPPAFTEFGSSGDAFLERTNVSLESVTVKTEMKYELYERLVDFSFTVHRPAALFDRDSKIPWREILEEGNSFVLEYGWKADPTACRNPLLNGQGYVDPGGATILSTRSSLFYVCRWNVNLQRDGSVRVTVNAMENGDIALRDARFSDAFETAFGQPTSLFGMVPRPGDDSENVARLKGLIDSLPRRPLKGKAELVSIGDVLDRVVAPMVDKVMRRHAGYDPDVPVDFLLADFNRNAGRQSVAYGGGTPRSIGDFMVPLSRLRELVSTDLAQGRAMTLRNFIQILISVVNNTEGWAGGPSRPVVIAGFSTVETQAGLRLTFSVFDRRSVADTLAGLQRIPREQQTPQRVRAALASANVPVIELAHAGSAVLDVNFEMQPHPLLQSAQIERASAGRKDRVQTTATPNVEALKGQAAPRDIVPISVLEGDVTMIGNFIFQPPTRAWVDFFGSTAISGIFNIVEQTDILESGKFVTQLHMISEGDDPLNTRFRRTGSELAEQDAAEAKRIEKQRKADAARKKG